jgi:23S rRNA pseudouridine1911/1915/1917 synthase
MRDNFEYELKGNREYRDGIVHRLDKETSGIVIVAKTKEAFEKLQLEFKERRVEKTYIALLHGKIDPDEGDIELIVGRLPYRRDRFGVVSVGRESKTLYKLIKFYKGERGGYSLVEFHPKTGRTHQIRIVAKHVGHAIVSDEFYAGRKTSRNDRKFCPRLFLHACKIKILGYEFESKLPDDLEKVLGVL